MSYRIKLPPKKHMIDEAQLMGGMGRLWFAMEEHRRGLLAGLAVLILAGLMVGGVVWYDLQQAQRALDIHLEANRFYATRPAGKPEVAANNLKEAIKRYRQVAKEFPRSAVAPHALYQLGLSLEQDNNFPGAVEAYEDLASTYGNTGPLLGLVYQRLGYAHLNDGKTDKAIEAFTWVLAVPQALNKDQSLFELGKLELDASRPEAAFNHFQDILDDYPQSPFANDARVRIKALEAPETETASPPQEEQ